MLVSAKLAPLFGYPVLEEFWRSAEGLGYHGIWNYDHFYGLTDPGVPTLEGWTTLAAMAAVTSRARVGCLVSGVTYRHPAVLANMAVAVDHISGGRLEFGIGAAWHEPEHRGLGIAYPRPGVRISMLDEALVIAKLLWTQEESSFEGRFWRLERARCDPKPLQLPHPPIVVGGAGPRLLAVAARHADEWNTPGADPEDFRRLSGLLDGACAAAGRDPKAIRRSVQLFVHPDRPEQAEAQFAKIPAYEAAGCDHIVLSFYSPPSREVLERFAPR